MRLRSAAAALLVASCGPGRSPPSSAVSTHTKGPGEACSASSECLTSLVCAGGTCGALAAAASCVAPPGTAAIHAGSVVFDPGDPGPSACVSTVVGSAYGGAADVSVQDLGEHSVGDLVSFAVTPGTSSLTIVSQEVSGSAIEDFVWSGTTIANTVVPDQVKTPGGAVYYDDVSGTSTDAVYLGLTPVSGAFTAPNTSAGVERLRVAGAFQPGTWSLKANDWALECLSISGCTGGSSSGRYHLHAVTKTAPVASTGAVDLEVYLLVDPSGPSSNVATAAAAAVDPQMKRWVSSVSSFLANAGLCLGDVTFHDLPTWVHQRFPNGSVDITKDGPCTPLQQLFTTAVVPRRAVHLFLVDELVSVGQGNAIAVGVDGSIPGPSGFPGTIYGGAAVGLFGELGIGSCSGSGAPALSTCGTDRVAYVAAHEVGHWLGLYHTTEATGDAFDPLTDTAQCPCSSCALQADRSRCSSGTVFVNAAQCAASSACGGGRNLMFWLVDPQISTGELSRDQGQVVRLNAAVR